MIAAEAWGFVEWFWNILTVLVGAVVAVFGLYVVARTIEPRGVKELLRRMR
jgi:hypothetical protein